MCSLLLVILMVSVLPFLVLVKETVFPVFRFFMVIFDQLTPSSMFSLKVMVIGAVSENPELLFLGLVLVILGLVVSTVNLLVKVLMLFPAVSVMLPVGSVMV